MTKKIAGILICIAGAILMLIAIFGLIKAFDTFSSSGFTYESMGYAFGSIVMPLLLVVFGKWMWRKGLKYFRS